MAEVIEDKFFGFLACYVFIVTMSQFYLYALKFSKISFSVYILFCYLSKWDK